ncbi:hypothetical protein DVH24_005515 [Malus domestica]|uniref:Uncharacterized protein n=1 Tax=Malus domestica TaxID=3750 RepID=A0A498IMQ0_MALDO|nr:hypothetical protein DVH24_005515 [Malus domestica]
MGLTRPYPFRWSPIYLATENCLPYAGHSNVYMGNGDDRNITHTCGKDKFYPLSLSSTIFVVPQAYNVVSSTTWHQRLGLPSSLVMSHLCSSLGPTIKWA